MANKKEELGSVKEFLNILGVLAKNMDSAIVIPKKLPKNAAVKIDAIVTAAEGIADNFSVIETLLKEIGAISVSEEVKNG